MGSECSVNFGITWASGIEIRSRLVEDFTSEIIGLAPGLSEAEHDQKSGTLTLFQLEGRVKVREVQVRANSLQSAAGWELGLKEQATFVRNVAQAAERLQLRMFDVKLLDLRHIYRVKHWGNHNDLIATTLFAGSPLESCLAAIDGNLTGLRLSFVKEPEGRPDLSVVVDLKPGTVPSEIRSGDYDGDQVHIACGIARTGGFMRVSSFTDVLDDLEKVWQAGTQDAIIRHVESALRGSAAPAKPKDPD